ncbi:MAG: hypothetical protein R6X10_14005 [Desulfobacterales bacterium]
MNPTAIKNSAYLAFGIFLSHLFHAVTYWSQGGKSLATWLTNFAPASSGTDFNRSIPVALLLAGCLSLFTIVIGIFFHHEQNKRSLDSAIKLCAGGLFLLIIASQAITSSVLRILYESGFASVFITSIIVQRVFLIPAKDAPNDKEQYERLWDLLRLSIPLVLGFSAVFGGVGAISSFYDTPQAFIHRQMYRHLYLTIYFALGMGILVMWPIFIQVLNMHWNLYVGKDQNEIEQIKMQEKRTVSNKIEYWKSLILSFFRSIFNIQPLMMLAAFSICVILWQFKPLTDSKFAGLLLSLEGTVILAGSISSGSNTSGLGNTFKENLYWKFIKPSNYSTTARFNPIRFYLGLLFLFIASIISYVE